MTQCIILTGGIQGNTDSPRVQRSLGPYRIATALEQAGYTTFVLDYIINFTVEEIKQALQAHLGPDTLWVGFSGTFFWKMYSGSKNTKNDMYYTDNDSEISKIFDFVHANSNAKMVYGGGGAHFHLVDNRIDFYIIGYADNTAIALTNYLMHNDINYLTHYEKITVSGEERILIDSKKYPEPKMNELVTSFQNVMPGEGLPIELARGCIFKCKFCNYPLIGKKKGTYIRDVEQVREELIEHYEKFGTTNYYFTDDTFNDDNDKIEALHRVFTSLPFKPQFSCYLRVDLIHAFPHQADLLTEMGLIGTYFGLETMQPKSATAIGKGLHPNKVKERLYWLDEKWHNKVNIGAGFILGLPYDTRDYFKEIYAWCREKDNPLDSIDFYPLHLYSRKDKNKELLSSYSSEFSLNHEIYGYEFLEDHISWSLKDTDLNYQEVGQIASWYRGIMARRNKYAEFRMINALNAGIELTDLYSCTIDEISRKYDVPKLCENKFTEYKKIVGAIKRD